MTDEVEGFCGIVSRFDALCKFVKVLFDLRDVKEVVDETLRCCFSSRLSSFALLLLLFFFIPVVLVGL